MRLARIGEIGAERPVAIVDDVAYDVRGLTQDFDGPFFAAGGIDRVREALAAGELTETAIEGERIGAPIARPTAVICIGMNYAAHAAESGSAPPAKPVIFLKHPNTVIGPNDEVSIPARSTRTDWEVELAIVIGKSSYEVETDDEAFSAIAGYTVADDVSERTWQLDESGGQWSKGKCGPGFTPTGPWLVPAADVDPGALRLTSHINGDVRQDSNTADLIFSVPTIIRELSLYMRLEPGDLILTGTPEGVALSGRFPYLKPGDVADIAIDGLGAQRHSFVETAAR